MRTFYIFNINNMINPMYERKTTNIYKIFNEIRKMDKKEFCLAKKLYKRLIIPINKYKIDDTLFKIHMNDFYYKKNNNIHELNSDMENSRLIINNTYMKIISTKNVSSFFKDLCMFNDNYFVIDFNNKDYFYLRDLKVKLLAN